jgi:hypothetical protein
MSGSMTATGSARIGHAGGALALTAAAGTLNLRLLGPDEGGLQPLPVRYRFAISGGSGGLRQRTGNGIALLFFTPPAIAHPVHGAFGVVLEVERV